jgi:hypothetical protein
LTEWIGISAIWIALIVWPARLMVPAGFTLLILQGVSELIKRIGFLMLLLAVLFPQMVTVALDKAEAVDIDSVEIVLPETGYDTPWEPPPIPPRLP